MHDKVFKIDDFKEMCEFDICNITYTEKYSFDEISLLLSRKVFVINLSNYTIAVISHISGNRVKLNEAHKYLLKEGYTGYYLRYNDFKNLLELRNVSAHSSESLNEFGSVKYNAKGIVELLEKLVQLCDKYNLIAIDLNPLTIDRTINQLRTKQNITFVNTLKYPTNTELTKRLIIYIKNTTESTTWSSLNGNTDKDKVISLLNKEVPHIENLTKSMNLF